MHFIQVIQNVVAGLWRWLIEDRLTCGGIVYRVGAAADAGFRSRCRLDEHSCLSQPPEAARSPACYRFPRQYKALIVRK